MASFRAYVISCFKKHLKQNEKGLDLFSAKICLNQRYSQNYLTDIQVISQKTLLEQYHLSLNERVVFLKQKYNVILNANKLSKIYKQAKISKKAVYKHIEPQKKDHLVEKRLKERILLFKRLDYCIDNGYRILFLDEIIFQNHENKMKAYSNTGKNIYLFKKSRYIKNFTVIACIDCYGLVYQKQINGFVNGKIYQEFLYELFDIVGSGKNSILFDGLPVHKMKMSWQLLLIEFGWVGILNVAYSPKQNPIEIFFSMIKKRFRRGLLESYKNCIENKNEYKPQKLIRKIVEESFEFYQNYDCSAIIKISYLEIEKNSGQQFECPYKRQENLKSQEEYLVDLIHQELDY